MLFSLFFVFITFDKVIMNAYPAEVRRHFENLSRLEIQIENKITELNVSSGPLTEITRINNSINYLLREYENLINVY